MWQSKINDQSTETEEEKTPFCNLSSTFLHFKTEEHPPSQFAHVGLSNILPNFTADNSQQ